jgi:glycosyltransferase involved in cell wall biosynthesis
VAPPRVLLLTTPLDERTRLDGARLAAIDLARALRRTGSAKPIMLVRPGTAPPENVEGVMAPGGAASVIAAVMRARPEILHAIFAPRRRTSIALALLRRALRAPVVQTIASHPKALRPSMLVGDAVVATSEACASELRGLGKPPSAVVPMPFAPPPYVHTPDDRLPRDLVLFAGDLEHGGAVEATIEAFAGIARPHGTHPVLAIAARNKSPAALRIARSLEDRVTLVGEQPSLLPWIAAARCVLLPARHLYAKLDHPRVLLEAIALGTRIVVGPAPSLQELVVDETLGEMARDAVELREAIERSFEGTRPEPKAMARALLPRGPNVVAAAYGDLYGSVL